jgi:hypothetical protein
MGASGAHEMTIFPVVAGGYGTEGPIPRQVQLSLRSCLLGMLYRHHIAQGAFGRRFRRIAGPLYITYAL